MARSKYLKSRLPHAALVISSNGGPATPRLAEALGPVVDAFNFHVEGVTPAVYEN